MTAIRIGAEIDYTTAALGGKFRVCPKCQRIGEFRQYSDGKGMVIHKATLQQFFVDVTDACSLSRAAIAKATG